MPGGIIFMYKSEGLLLQKLSLRILTTDVGVAHQGFLTFSCQKTHSETSQFCCLLFSVFPTRGCTSIILGA